MVTMYYVTLEFWRNSDPILTRYKANINITTSTEITLMVRTIFKFICYDRFCPLNILINFKIIGKVPSGICWVSLISDTISCWYVDLCVVSWLKFKGIIDSPYVTMFFSTLIYSISGPNSSSISLHINTISVLKFYM